MEVIAKEILVRIGIDDRGCPVKPCSDRLDYMDFNEKCKHMLQDHGLACVYVGQEANGHDAALHVTNVTVAVFAK